MQSYVRTEKQSEKALGDWRKHITKEGKQSNLGIDCLINPPPVSAKPLEQLIGEYNHNRLRAQWKN